MTLGRGWMFAAALALLVFATSVGAQVLWKSAAYGMSVAQVKSVVPKASDITSRNDALANGATALLREGGVQIGGHPFNATYFFKEGRLHQVTLGTASPRPFVDMIEPFKDVRAALRNEFGRETNSSESINPAMGKMETEWALPGRRVGVLLLGIGKNPALLNINYQPATESSAKPAKPVPVPKVTGAKTLESFLASPFADKQRIYKDTGWAVQNGEYYYALKAHEMREAMVGINTKGTEIVGAGLTLLDTNSLDNTHIAFLTELLQTLDPTVPSSAGKTIAQSMKPSSSVLQAPVRTYGKLKIQSARVGNEPVVSIRF